MSYERCLKCGGFLLISPDDQNMTSGGVQMCHCSSIEDLNKSAQNTLIYGAKADFHQKSKWRSLNEQLPEGDEFVIYLRPEGTKFYVFSLIAHKTTFAQTAIEYGYTHWCEIPYPLPELPTLASLRGIAPNCTGDMMSEDFVRKIRGEWDGQTEQRKPAEVFHPGVHLKDELKARNIYPLQYSRILDMDTYVVRNIINGKMNISEGIADKLSAALDTSSEFWMNLQRAWDEREK